MSELKSVYIDRTGDWCRSGNDTGAFYLKSEADKVIARHKYKRCLAMARWCYDRRIRAYLSNKIDKTRFYVRWHKRWLKIAQKFKEAK